MGDVKTYFGHAFNHGRGWRGTCHHASHLLINASAHTFGCVVNEAVNDGCCAVVVHAVLSHGVKDRTCFNTPQAHMRAGQHGHRPGKAPTIAMEHGQGPQISGKVRHGPSGHVAHGIEVGAAVMRDHAFGVARGTAGIAHSNGIPLVLWAF